MAFEPIKPIVDRVMAAVERGVPQPVVLILPEPCSANRWWRRAGNRMHLSHEAREYKALVGNRLALNGDAIFPDEDIRVALTWCRSRRSGDLDKRLGIVIDALQTWKDAEGIWHPGVYNSDSQITEIIAHRCDSHAELKGGMIRVAVSVASDIVG
jgi:Holliday junction resolvase RusA-like endonuclease